MKTAMQELIDWIKEHRDNDKILMQQHVIAKGYELLEKEKEQIIDAYDKGSDVNDDLKPLYGTPEEYYNQTYNQTYNQKQLIIDIMKADEDDGLYKMSEEEIRDWHMIQSLKEKYGE
jgi:hypothetical protein